MAPQKKKIIKKNSVWAIHQVNPWHWSSIQAPGALGIQPTQPRAQFKSYVRTIHTFIRLSQFAPAMISSIHFELAYVKQMGLTYLNLIITFLRMHVTSEISREVRLNPATCATATFCLKTTRVIRSAGCNDLLEMLRTELTPRHTVHGRYMSQKSERLLTWKYNKSL